MTRAMTLRLPDALHDELRQEAFDRRTTITTVIIERLSGAIAKREQEVRRKADWRSKHVED